MKEYKILISVGLIVCYIALSVLFVEPKTSPGSICLIPSDFVGRICVYYNDQNADALSTEDDFRILNFSASGVMRTKNELMFGTGYIDHYFYIDASKARTPVPWDHFGGGGISVLQRSAA